MLFFWQRRELLTTYDLAQYQCVKEKLQAVGIAYRTQTGSFGGADHASHRRGTLGIDDRFVVDYHIYVRQKDYDAAVQCLRQC